MDDSSLDPDGCPLPESGTVDEFLTHFVYPGELPVLADLARMFLAWGEPSRRLVTGRRLSDAAAVSEAVHPLLAGLEVLLGMPPEEASSVSQPENMIGWA